MPRITHRPSKKTATPDGHTTAVPQNVLDLIHGALLPYPVQWDRVRAAILSPDDLNKSKAVSVEEDQFLSTEELCEFIHASRTSIFRLIKAGNLRAYKIGRSRRNLFSLREVLATLKNVEVTNA